MGQIVPHEECGNSDVVWEGRLPELEPEDGDIGFVLKKYREEGNLVEVIGRRCSREEPLLQ
jgi:hypothetical protein